MISTKAWPNFLPALASVSALAADDRDPQTLIIMDGLLRAPPWRIAGLSAGERSGVHRGFRRAMGAAAALCHAGVAASSKRCGICSDHTHCRHLAVQLNCNSRSNSRV